MIKLCVNAYKLRLLLLHRMLDIRMLLYPLCLNREPLY
jgi:hypothetical protein